MRKDPKIQMLRGLAIMAVVLIHSCPGGMGQVLIRPFLNFCVPMFFFLSGHLTCLDRGDWLAFFRKRITRVLVPYVLWSIIYTLMDGGGLWRLFSDLLTTNAAPQLYFVAVYIQFVLLTPLLGKLARSRYRWLGLLVSPVSLILFRYSCVLTGHEMNKYLMLLWREACLGHFTFYYLGLLTGNGLVAVPDSRKDPDFRKKLSICLALSILLQMAEGYGWMCLGVTDHGT